MHHKNIARRTTTYLWGHDEWSYRDMEQAILDSDPHSILGAWSEIPASNVNATLDANGVAQESRLDWISDDHALDLTFACDCCESWRPFEWL